MYLSLLKCDPMRDRTVELSMWLVTNPPLLLSKNGMSRALVATKIPVRLNSTFGS